MAMCMAIGTIGEWLKLFFFFFVKGRKVGCEGGGGWHFLKIESKYSALGPSVYKQIILHPSDSNRLASYILK